MQEAELRFLSALLEATRQNLMTWSLVEDDDRAIYHAVVGTDSIAVELVYVPTAGKSSERLLARVSGLGVYFHAAVGTRAYHVISEMLSLQIFGWADGRAGALKSLATATAQVNGLLATSEDGRG
jgi:hypothetical protein